MCLRNVRKEITILKGYSSAGCLRTEYNMMAVILGNVPKVVFQTKRYTYELMKSVMKSEGCFLLVIFVRIVPPSATIRTESGESLCVSKRVYAFGHTQQS